MSHEQRPWSFDPARTQKGVGLLAGVGADPAVAGRQAGRRMGARIGRVGHVFEVEGTGDGEHLVVKLFPRAAGLAPQVVQGFTAEALRVASLRHPHVVQVVEAGSVAGGIPFAILERLRGQTVAELLARQGQGQGQPQAPEQGTLPVREILPILRGLVSALAAAHAAGIVHGELRAENIFLADLAGYPGGFPKLLDFGVARLTAGARAAGRVVEGWSAGAVAPEQRRDFMDGAEQRSDQFALAALAFRLITGVDPAAGGGGGGGPFGRLRGDGRQPREALAHGAPLLHAVLARAMSLEPGGRFASIDSFFRAFEDAASVRPVAASPAPVAPPPPVAAPAPIALPPPVAPAAPVAAPAIVAAPIAAAPAAAPVIAAAKAPPPASSLTQQFFAEGDRQEQQANAPEPDDDSDDAEDASDELAASGTFDRVPRKRGTIVLAAAIGLGALSIIGGLFAWTVTRDRATASPSAPSGATTSPPAPAITPDPPPPPAGRPRQAAMPPRKVSRSTEPPPVSFSSAAPTTSPPPTTAPPAASPVVAPPPPPAASEPPPADLAPAQPAPAEAPPGEPAGSIELIPPADPQLAPDDPDLSPPGPPPPASIPL